MTRAPKSVEQKQRLAAALRENLKRRKARARALADEAAEGLPQSAAEEPGSGPQKGTKPD